MNRRLLLPLLLCFVASSSIAQSKYDIALCCKNYKRGYFNFGIVNNADTAMRFLFENIEMHKRKQVVRSYDICRDTLICQLMKETHIVVGASSSYNIDITTNDEPYFQRKIDAKTTLLLSIKLRRKYFKHIHWLKVIEPDTSFLLIDAAQ